MACTIRDKLDADFCFHGARDLLKHLNAMMGMIDGVRRNEDIECLHRMRVASRRLRSLLPLFTDCLPSKQSARWRRQLRRVARALGKARDADVQIVCLQEALDDCSDDRQRPGLERLLLRFKQQRQAMQAPLVSTLERPTTGRQISRMEMALRYLLATSQLYGSPESARHACHRSRDAILRRLQAVLATAATIRGPQSAAELHATRITIKRLRYTLQTFAPLYQDALNDAIRTSRRLQDVLGNLHDCDVWVETLPLFLEEEKARTLAYFGDAEPFKALVPGVMDLRDQRRQRRVQHYEAFEALWQRAQDEDVWGRLCRALDTPLLPVHDSGPESAPALQEPDPTETGPPPLPEELTRLEATLRASPQAWQWHVATLITRVPAGRLITYGHLADWANASCGLHVSASNVAWLRTRLQNLLGDGTAVPLHRLAKSGDPYSRRETPARKKLNDQLRASEGSLAHPLWWQP
jgi:CHAD domain-containing protein/alkylated DNA nucleotide flippase Atl1